MKKLIEGQNAKLAATIRMLESKFIVAEVGPRLQASKLAKL